MGIDRVYSGWAPWDQASGTSVPQVSSYLFAALNQDHQFLSEFSNGEPVKGQKLSWIERSLNPGSITGAEARSDSDTTLDIPDAQRKFVQVGFLLQDIASGKQELLQVTARGALSSGSGSTTRLTISRGYGTSTAEAHADGATYRVIPAKETGSQPGDDQSRARATRYNYVHTIDTYVDIPGDTLVTEWYNVENEMNEQAMHAAVVCRDQMRNAFLNSLRAAADPADDNAVLTAGGIREFIKQTANGATWGTPAPAADTTYDNTAETFSYDIFNDMMGSIFDNGAQDGQFVAAMKRDLFERLGQYGDPKMREQYPGGGSIGQYVDTVVTRQGIKVKCFIEDYMPHGEVLIVDKTRIKPRAMQGYEWKAFEYPLGSLKVDAAAIWYMGKWTYEIHNPDKAHALHTNLT